MVLETEGHVGADGVREALAGALAAHPVTLAPLRISLLSGRPYWAAPVCADAAAGRAVGGAFSCDDLSQMCPPGQGGGADARWEEHLERLCLERYVPRWGLEGGANLRLEQYLLPDGRTRFRLLWPHFLMDAEGAQWFFREIDRCFGSRGGRAEQTGDGAKRKETVEAALLPDGAAMDLLAGSSFLERVRLFRRGFSLQTDAKGLEISALASGREAAVESLGLIHRCWSARELEAIHAAAKGTTPAGPALYARHLAACVVRALHRLYGEQGARTAGYLITFPMRPAGGRDLDVRPVHGNYLVSPVLCARRELALDRQALGESILRQLGEYRRRQGDSAQWAMVWAASFLRASYYDLIFRLPLGFERLSTGFSYYGEIGRPIRSFCGARVVNFLGGGPLGTPPGWNPVFSRWHDRLNLSLTWNRPQIADGLAARYAALIEAEVFATA
jgi:hypothetical protein